MPPIQEFANEAPKLECEQINDLLAFWQTGEIEFAEGRQTDRAVFRSRSLKKCHLSYRAVPTT